MFTGIIEKLASVNTFENNGNFYTLSIKSPFPIDTIKLGESIAINGVCLTVSSIKNNLIFFDLQEETISKTYFKEIKNTDLLNIERALALGDRLGGHMVQGHVDEVGSVISNKKSNRDWVLEITASDDFIAQLIKKGSVTIDGISLTIVNKTTDRFSVHVVPHTLENTNLKNKNIGDKVNLEADVIGKYVYNYLSNQTVKNDISLMTKLEEGGFI